MNITCPQSMVPHVQQVLDGEYNIQYEGTPTITDLGANVGSFAVWASMKWPGCTIHCYEPSKSNFELLSKNISQISNSTVICRNEAVGDKSLTRLYKGKNNIGECSLYKIGEQSDEFEDIITVAPETIPETTILKLDVEGAEGYILSKLKDFNKLTYSIILLEYHGEDNRRQVDRILEGYSLVGGKIYRVGRGVLKYMKI